MSSACAPLPIGATSPSAINTAENRTRKLMLRLLCSGGGDRAQAHVTSP
jgi:hypothetical protein